MQVIAKKTHCGLYSFITANEEIAVNITSGNNGPEAMLSDGSILAFNSVPQYFSIITDTDITTDGARNINLDVLKLKYFVVSDEAGRSDIADVELYMVNDKPLYRFIMA